MKKQNLNSLKLNKKSISNLNVVIGGRVNGGTTDCPTGPNNCPWPTSNDLCAATTWGPNCGKK